MSRYAALELYVFHLVIQSARHRLGLNPPAIGANCMYRSEALRQIGGFPQGAISDDVETSFAVTERGWRTSFLADAIVSTEVPTTLPHFLSQRQRWTRGLLQAAKRAHGLVSIAVVLGYVDRLVLFAGLVAAILGYISIFWPVLYFVGPALTIWIALQRAGEPRRMRFILACLPMFVLDVGSTIMGTLASLLQPVPAG